MCCISLLLACRSELRKNVHSLSRRSLPAAGRMLAMGSSHETGPSGDTLRGITLKIASVTVFVAMSSLVKAAGQVPAGQIVFFRAFFAILPILTMLAWQGQLRMALYTTNPLGHIVRGAVGVMSMGCTFFALTRLPLPEAVMLNYAQPLLVVVLSALFLGEAVRAYRWTAVLVGMVGVVIISWPNLSLFRQGVDAGQASGVLAALMGAGFSAVAMLLVRRLVHTERSPTIVMWFSLSATVAGLMTIPFGWAVLDVWQWICLVLVGICGGVAQILMTEAYRHAEASTVAPFEYTSIIIAIIVGYFAFSDVPTVYTIVGGIIVVGAGIFIIMRERRLGLERSAVQKTI